VLPSGLQPACQSSRQQWNMGWQGLASDFPAVGAFTSIIPWRLFLECKKTMVLIHHWKYIWNTDEGSSWCLPRSL